MESEHKQNLEDLHKKQNEKFKEKFPGFELEFKDLDVSEMPTVEITVVRDKSYPPISELPEEEKVKIIEMLEEREMQLRGLVTNE